jgi:polysaccharide export outer membrane protein
VMLAGGLTPYANPNKSLLYRRADNGVLKAHPVLLDDILNKGKLETNYALLPSDIVSVPEGGF